MESSVEVTSTVNRYYDALGKGDMAALKALVSSDGMSGFGTDPAEVWDDGQAFLGSMAYMLQAMGGALAFVPAEIHGWREGVVGWATDRPSIKMPDGSPVPVRLSVVLHREDNDWKIVHLHASMPVSMG